MARDPLSAYRPNWICRLIGHNNNASWVSLRTDYCVRCFLPVVPELVKYLEEYRELVREQTAIADLDKIIKGGKDAASGPSA